MPANLLKPRQSTLVTSAARTATGNSGSLTIPLGESYAFLVDVTAVSGTTPTLDLSIQVAVDATPTFYTAARFAQITSVSTRRLQIQPTQGRGEAGSETAIANTGGALNSNTIITRKIRVLWTIAGTNPSFTFIVYMLSVPKQAGTY